MFSNVLETNPQQNAKKGGVSYSHNQNRKTEDVWKTNLSPIIFYVVDGYKKIETGVVEGFEKVTDKCVEVLFAREGESAEQARERLAGKQSKTDKE